MEDIVEDLRATAGDTDAVENASVARLLEKAADEIARLRLTAEERAEIESLAGAMETLELCFGEDDLCRKQSEQYGAYARLLTAMLKRTE